MCYTIKINLTREELEKQFGVKFEQTEDYATGDRVTAFSLPRLPVICSDNSQEIKILSWGLIPYWVKDIKTASEIRMKTFNAKAETLSEKPSFRNSLNRRRCLVLTQGFYEWHTEGKEKTPYYICLKDRSAFTLAGLFDQWKNEESGEILKTFTVITTRANTMMEQIHNLKKRMPVILSSEAEQLWLDLKTDPVKSGLFEPFPEDKMFAEISKR
jgi:putative SOS response-associated peptidase YedK